MASQSAIAEGNPDVSADSINYQQKFYSHPSYKFEPQFSNTYGQPIVITSSQTPVTINVPPEVFNLSQSYLQYTVNIPANSLTTYTWMHLQALRELSHIQFFSGSNMFICDLDQLQNYLDITLKKELEQEEFLSLSALTGISQSNSVVNVVPALRNSNILTQNTANRQTNPSSVNYNEPAYFQVSALNDSIQYIVQFPLRLIKNTVFSIDKDLFFGQTTYLKCYFGPTSKICYVSDSNINPSAGTKTSYIPAAGTSIQIGGAMTGTNPNSLAPIQFQLMLAVECNQELRTRIINKVASVGQAYNIPYVQSFKNSNSGASQNISIQLDGGNGKTLLKAYHAPYNTLEDMDTAYDHSNNDTVAGVVSSANNQKVFTYYTQLNGKRNQDITIDCTVNGPFTDYMYHRRQVRGSILSNLNVFQYNWAHCDDFADFGPKYDQSGSGELISGIPMGVAPLTWSFVGLTLRNVANSNSFQWYTWFVFVKKLIMSPGTVIVQ